MNLSDLADIGSLINGVAVLASLIYLSVQVRHAQRTQRASMHQARVEVIGDEMLMSIDGKPAGYLKSEGLNHPTKNMLGFEISGKSIQLDNVKAWEATASPAWLSLP